MKKSKPTRKAVSPGEQAMGRRQLKINGRNHHEDVSEKMGADGVIETHVNYSHTEKKYYGRPKHTMCAQCKTWIVEDYKRRPHGKGCRYA